MYTSTPHYVRTPEELADALQQLAQSPFVAIDTEFLRERTYYPKFCLLQIAHDNYCALVDVLELPTLRPLLDFLCDRSRLKVLHAAHQDLEVLALANGAARGLALAPLPGPFFDTQVAAAFLDMPGNIGYADLVQRRLNHTLNKGQARTDWSRRPLSDEQFTYAAADVTYLVELYHNLRNALSQTARLSWLEEDAKELEDPTLYATEPSQAWQRLRGLEHMAPEKRSAAKALAAWRERRAMSKDLPRTWVLSDDSLRQISERLPATLEELAAIKELSRGNLERRGEELLTLLATAKTNAVNERPASDFRPSLSQQGTVRTLMEYIRKQSGKLHVSPERLASRREIEAWVFHKTKGPFCHGWRLEAFGQRLIELAEEARQHSDRQDESKQLTAEQRSVQQPLFAPASEATDSETTDSEINGSESPDAITSAATTPTSS